MTVRLRPATPSDWPAIAALLEGHHLPLDGAAQHLRHFIVAQGDDGLIGVGGLEICDESALLRSLAVAHPRTGLGSQLVEHLIDHARESGVRDLVLLTITAGEFFARFGFAPMARGDVPAALLASAEFTGACPSSAFVMHRAVGRAELP